MIFAGFILGTVVGSGLTALLSRLATGESWVRGRSRCPRCKRTLSAFELIPLVSWLVQRGRCRGCRRRIDASYPLIELATGLLFAFGMAARFGPEPLGAFLREPAAAALIAFRDAYAIASLLVVFVFDLTHGLILDRITLPSVVILGLLSLALGMPPVTLALGILVGAGFFAAQYVLSRGRWIGGGDIRLGAMLGALLGWKLLFVALFAAYVSGAIVAVVLVARREKRWGSTIPFGTFLSAGALFALYFGDAIIRWYAGM